jgi:hypothetical protein
MAFRSVPRPSSPPGAKASTECPSYARKHPDRPPGHPDDQSNPMHRNHPRPTRPRTLPHGSCSAHIAPEPTAIAGPRSPMLTHDARKSGQTCDRARPETHQNLIHHFQRTRHPRRPTDPPLPADPSSSLSRDTNPTTPPAFASGGDDRVRTDDPLLAKQVLSQLSYAPRTSFQSPVVSSQMALAPDDRKLTTDWWAREDLNLRPHAYQACALTS